MKKIYSILVAIMVAASILIAGCGDSKPIRPSVKTVNYEYSMMDADITSALLKNDERCKKDLDGKVVEVLGVIDNIGKYSGSQDEYVEFRIRRDGGRMSAAVVASIKNVNDPNYAAVRRGRTTVIRGYASVNYDKKRNEAALTLLDAEVMDVFGNNGSSVIKKNSGLYDYVGTLSEAKVYPNWK